MDKNTAVAGGFFFIGATGVAGMALSHFTTLPNHHGTASLVALSLMAASTFFSGFCFREASRVRVRAR